MMLMRTDPFRELDRLTQQVFGTAARPAAMPMDAWQEDGEFVVAFDLPGISPDAVDLNVERNVLTVRANAVTPPSRTSSWWSPNGRAASSAARSFSATPWTRTRSRPATTLAC